MPPFGEGVANGPAWEFLRPREILHYIEDVRMYRLGLVGLEYALLGALGTSRLNGGTKACTHPGAGHAHRENPRHRPSRCQTPCGEDGKAGHLAHLEHSLQERHGAHTPGVTSGVGALGHEEICACFGSPFGRIAVVHLAEDLGAHFLNAGYVGRWVASMD